MKVTVKVAGLRDLEKALADITSRATRKRVGQRALLQGAEPLVTRARQLAPELTGQLMASIDETTRKPRRHRRKVPVEVFVGPGQQPHAHLNEFGTREQAARPFMRPAWDATRVQVLDGIKDALADEIDKAAKRQARKAARAARKGA
ncbi:MAG: HK97-gp10 family putative phage morphogenesis protein [Brevundimonas sp.]|jgi:HK97 gp10 family phage protein|uniref:HK97-gp10 family putative phage morphogenesis protein n=1 Tax=Brevundimonas sp. TaxID=1871086 RepID=UPI00391F8996